MKLRTQFLISVLVILLGLSAATLLVVQHICKTQIRKVLLDELNSSLLAFRTFEQRHEAHLTSAAELMASQPSLRALMTTHDLQTIQDGSKDLRALVGSDLLILTDRDARVVALHTSAASVTPEMAQEWLRESVRNWQECRFWFVAGHLFETFSQPIYFGPPSSEHLLGILTVGYEIDSHLASDVGVIASSKVAFQYGNQIAVTSLNETSLAQRPTNGKEPVAEVAIGPERFLLTSVTLATSPAEVRLVVFKSLDEASAFLRVINRILVSLGLIATAVGCVLVFAISQRFMKTLEELIAGVHALQKQKFDYPLDLSGKDELARLTRTFDQMRRSLIKAQDKLVESARLATIGRMASSISHDLRHRLTAVVANAEFLTEDKISSGRRQELFGEVNKGVRGMTDLLESMLELSRPSHLHREFIAMRTILRRVVGTIRCHPDFAHVEITVECDVDVQGWFDPTSLERVFYNLTLNACEMLRQQCPARIDIKASVENQSILVRVTDNGPGVADCVRDSLFRAFVSYGKRHGSGLGLAIVQKCCQDHGGSVSLESSKPGRTTFLIVLPIVDPGTQGPPPDVSSATTKNEPSYGLFHEL